MTAHNDLSDGAQALLAALTRRGSGEVKAVDLVEEEVIFDELAALEYALELLKHGEPIRVHSGLASDWVGLRDRQFSLPIYHLNSKASSSWRWGAWRHACPGLARSSPTAGAEPSPRPPRVLRRPTGRGIARCPGRCRRHRSRPK